MHLILIILLTHIYVKITDIFTRNDVYYDLASSYNVTLLIYNIQLTFVILLEFNVIIFFFNGFSNK